MNAITGISTSDKSALAAAVREAWSGAETNAEATDRLLAIMQSDMSVYAAAMAPHERRVAANLVAQNKIIRRAYIWSRPAAPDNRVAALSRANAVSLYDMRLPSGKRLGDATRDDVAAASADYASRAQWNADKARFFNAVARRMGNTGTVSSALTAAQLEEIKNA